MSDAVEREILKTLVEINYIEHQNNRLLWQIAGEVNPYRIERFVIAQQENNDMSLLPIAPGFSPVFTATPVPASSVPNPATPPTWTTSDSVNAPISVDPTGLVCTVALPSSAVVGTSVTLAISYTNADGTPATGTITVTIVAAPSPDITSFTITQTS